MKYFILAAGLLATMATAAAADLLIVETNAARVYSAPALASPVVGQLMRNEICAVAESGWLYIIMPDGRDGWLPARDGRRVTTQQAAAEAAAQPAQAPAIAATDSGGPAGLPPAPEIDPALYEEARRHIIRYLPNYSTARPLTVPDLALFAGNDEQLAAREQGNRYVLRGDFNGNGRQEIAIVGLLAPQPHRDGSYRAFLLVVEERGRDGRVKLFYNGEIGLQRGQVENAFLFTAADGALHIGFANNSGFMARLLWDGRGYRIDGAAAE